MQDDFERVILRNPALGAVLLWEFSAAYVSKSPEATPPTLADLMLVLPMILHGPTVKKIKRMVPSTGLSRAILDEPEILANLQSRLESLASSSLDALAVANAAALLERSDGGGMPTFSPRASLPPRLESQSPRARDMRAACRRLGIWFGSDGLVRTCAQLRVRF